jgi:8-oxo-dGTP pyrophosphatase MutT (NUDIX family)
VARFYVTIYKPTKNKELVMSLLKHITACNHWNPEDFRPFYVDDRAVGLVRKDFAVRLAAFGDCFRVGDDQVRLAPGLKTPEARTAAVSAAYEKLIAAGAAPAFKHELYPVAERWAGPELLRLDRAAVPLFGVRAYGVHINGFVRDGDNLRLWIGRRGRDRAVAPGKLDNMVGGGQPAGLSLKENIIKECAEEAGLSPAMASQAKPVGAVSYRVAVPEGLRRDVLFCYDLELPPDFVPQNTDGEVEEFLLMEIPEILERLRYSQDFKFNVPLVLADFLIRHGKLTPDEEIDYLAIIKNLHDGESA